MTIAAVNVRNQFKGKVREIVEGPVVSEVDVETFATGLNEHRGLAFDPTGDLLVAEAGTYESNAAGGSPVSQNQSGRVVRIGANGQISVFVGPRDLVLLNALIAPGKAQGPSLLFGR